MHSDNLCWQGRAISVLTCAVVSGSYSWYRLVNLLNVMINLYHLH